MGVLGFLMTSVGNVITSMVSKLPGFNLDTSQLSSSLSYLQNSINVVNSIFPMDTVLQVLSVLCAFAVAMLAFYFLQRLINLLRGAG